MNLKETLDDISRKNAELLLQKEHRRQRASQRDALMLQRAERLIATIAEPVLDEAIAELAARGVHAHRTHESPGVVSFHVSRASSTLVGSLTITFSTDNIQFNRSTRSETLPNRQLGTEIVAHSELDRDLINRELGYICRAILTNPDD